ncbi:MAG TPA: hypothetical protein PJ988_10880, partial [Anaerolinea sp.]|nr:hypothetical protein [Anaerolinea sp.]
FTTNDVFGARAQQDGTVIVYKNGVSLGSVNVTTTATPWPVALAQGGGQIGLWFVGTADNNSTRIDNFGGGDMP